MKKKLYLAVLAIALSVLATPSQAQECARARSLLLTVYTYHLDLNDRMPVCVTLSDIDNGTAEFRIRIQDRDHLVFLGSVKIEAKNSEDAKINISGINDKEFNEIIVKVSLVNDSIRPALDEEYEYFIQVDGVGILDPRIRIIP